MMAAKAAVRGQGSGVSVAPAIVSDQVRQIELGNLLPAKWNARKTLDKDALNGLVESIKAAGRILTPLLVRPFLESSWHMPGLQPKMDAGELFEIVAGCRRFAAAGILEYTYAPCIVREMTDPEARDNALIDNLQRANIPPLEEANAFDLLLVNYRTVEAVAGALGLAPTYIARRLKLLDAIEPVKDALSLGAIDVGHALELVRLTPPDQVRMLTMLNIGFDATPDGGEGLDSATPTGFNRTAMSVAGLRREIERRVLRVLTDAPFSLTEPLSGAAPACADCLKRTGGSALLFADVGRTDVCTDPACYRQKLDIYVEAALESAKKKKVELARVTDDYSAQKSGAIYLHGNVRVLGPDEHCAGAQPAIQIDGAQKGRSLAICNDPKCPTHSNAGRASAGAAPRSGSRSPAIKKASPAEKAAADTKLAEEKAFRLRLWNAIAAHGLNSKQTGLVLAWMISDSVRDVDLEIRPALARAVGLDPKDLAEDEDAEDEEGETKPLRDALGKKPVEVMARFWLLESIAFEGLNPSEYSLKDEPCKMLNFAELLGIDVKKLRGMASPPVKPLPVKALPEIPGRRGLSPAAKKRIADAMKKRWAVAQAVAKPKPSKPAAKKPAAKKKAGKR